MTLIAGSPGTWSGMALRVSQCAFAVASVCALVTTIGSSNYSAFDYMDITMRMQLMWSLGIAFVDIYSIRNKKDFHDDQALVTLIVIGDWIMAVLAFSGASASASLLIFFMKDMNFCTVYRALACGHYTLSGILASIVWLLDAASSFSGFWLLVSFY